MLPPNSESVSKLSRETGIPRNTLNYWRLTHAEQNEASSGQGSGISSEDKFAILLEAPSMNEHELSAYCRKKGLYPQQVRAWRKQCEQANERGSSKVDKKELQNRANRYLKKKSPTDLGGARGRKITFADRRRVIGMIDEACMKGARLQKACGIVGISARSLQRWRRYAAGKDGREQAAKNRSPAYKLADSERKKIIAVCNQPEYEYMTPHQIVPDLADKGIYIASESSFYRVLRDAGQLAHRGRAKAPANKMPEPVVAAGPKQVWSWDITLLRSTILGYFFYLYMIVDVYSRKIVGWDVFETEDSEHASSLFYKTYLREGITGEELVLHSDNGSPMKGATMLATLQKLGVAPSFSRPGVSNDNPYSEALFKTLKYQPVYPQRPFDSVEEARQSVADFTEWYNEIHRHCKIKFVTPGQRHRGEDEEILRQRRQLYERMKKATPARWTGAICNWQPVEKVKLNPGKSGQDRAELKAA